MGVVLYRLGRARALPIISKIALHGKNHFEVVKISIRALPIIFRKCRPCAVGIHTICGIPIFLCITNIDALEVLRLYAKIKNEKVRNVT